jgi:hypothetical protein
MYGFQIIDAQALTVSVSHFQTRVAEDALQVKDVPSCP